MDVGILLLANGLA